jgi:hypothetical protein
MIETGSLTTHAAKRLLREELERRGLRKKVSWTRLTVRTVDFTDLARARCVFVTVHGWTWSRTIPRRSKETG